MLLSISRIFKAFHKLPILPKKGINIHTNTTPFFFCSSLAAEAVMAEQQKVAFSKKANNVKPRELEQKLTTCKSLNDYQDCFNSLITLAEHKGQQKIHKPRIIQFLVSINQVIKFQEVSLGFLKSATKFMARYDLLDNFDYNLLIGIVRNRKASFLEHQNEVFEILNFLLPNIPSNTEQANTLLKEIEGVFLNRVEGLKNRNLFNLYYHYQNGEFPKNEAFVKALENEIILRADSFTQQSIEESAKIFTLASRTANLNPEVTLALEGNITSNLNKIDDSGLQMLVIRMSHAQEFSKSFCVEFERVISEKCPTLSNKTLLEILNFITLEQFKLSTDLIYQIQIELISRRVNNLNKYLIKDLTQSDHYKHKNSLVNNLFRFSQPFNEARNEPSSSTTTVNKPKDKAKAAMGIFEERKNTLRTGIIKDIQNIKDPLDLKLIVNISLILNIEDQEIVNAMFQQLLHLQKSNELSLTYLVNLLHSFLEMKFYIDLQRHQELLQSFTNDIKLRVHEASPATCSDLVRVLCQLMVCNPQNSNLGDLLGLVAGKMIQEKYFYIIQERLDLLYHLSMNVTTCYSPLIEFLFSFFNSKNNKFYEKEVHYMNQKQFYIIWTLIKTYRGAPLEVEIPDLEKILEKGQRDLEEQENWLRGKRAKSLYFKDTSKILNRYRSQIKNFAVIESPHVDCFTVDFQLVSKKEGEEDTVVYVDIVHPWNYYINDKDMLAAEIVARKEYMKYKKYNYATIDALGEDASLALRESLIKGKLGRWFPELCPVVEKKTTGEKSNK